ncbi:hypothetical protein F5Y16DRAFT_604 [Xylariaceae sp. FL0255]|nr:hypothetical protein F5Y16DRAFT_604 [Xylariaceae sp. FL0255]
MILPPPSLRSELREIKDRRRVDSWLPLTNLASVVVICWNLGVAIKPESRHLCPSVTPQAPPPTTPLGRPRQHRSSEKHCRRAFCTI